MNLVQVDRIYLCSTDATIVIHEVADPGTAKFAYDLRELEKSAAEIEASDHLQPMFRLFRRIRFVLASTPLPPQHMTVKLDEAVRSIERAMPLLRPAFPELIEKAAELATRVGVLLSVTPHPLEMKLLQLVGELPYEGSACVAIKDSRLAEATKTYFSEKEDYSRLHVVSPFELRDAEPYGGIFLFGPPRWLIDDGFGFLFQAPRAERTDVISYTWLGNQMKVEPAFPSNGISPSLPRIRIVYDTPKETDFVEKIEPIEVLPSFNVEEFKQRLHGQLTDSDEEDAEDLVEAKVALLAGGKAVFLDYSDGARSYTIDLRESPDTDDEEAFLVREANTDIEEGKFLLLRTQGGGDLIPIVAERILGDTAQERMSLQHKWKSLLKWYIEHQGGREQTAKKLSTLGATAARPVNISNWIRTRNIRPGADQDFDAVLKLVGLEQEAPRFFQNAAVILNARMRAGTTIRKLLLAEVKRSNLTELKEKGAMTFQLSELDAGGSMTAFRIEKILSDIHHTPYAKVSCPFPVSDDLWL